MRVELLGWRVHRCSTWNYGLQCSTWNVGPKFHVEHRRQPPPDNDQHQVFQP